MEKGNPKPALSPDEYLSIKASSEGLYKDNGSRFLSLAYPVKSAEEAEDIVKALRKEHYNATHHCYAYRIGLKGDTWRINDDGEPSGTAGRPILGEILSRNLSDVMVVVVRWFGGVKLGVPGLIRAYKAATQEALDAAETIVKTATVPVRIYFSYQQTDKVLRELRKRNIEDSDKKFEEECSLTAHVPLSMTESLKEILLKIEDVRID
ncbi:MAG: YigZ family protein [Bacteroidales bacterium]|nr:YigZ family protein [Bacteroidales bacterium]MBP5517756.1 YigZ family protein [Bacteroidales bacterium]